LDCFAEPTNHFAKSGFILIPPAPTFAPVATPMVDAALDQTEQEQIMKRTLAAALFVSLFASTAAFADGGIGHSGSYQDQSWIGTSTKTRAQVRAELVAARRDGTLASLNKQSYPDLGLEGQTQAARVALQEDNANGRVSLARAGQ
jgi:hypothetical protein